MKPSVFWDLARTAILHPHVFRYEVNYLFLLSHMRSLSTLLAHILGSHREIVGYREWMKPYRSHRDFQRLRYQSWKDLKWKSTRFLQDKILHDPFTPTPDCFHKFPIRSLIFIREPVVTIRSIIALGIKRGLSDFQNPDWATKYYCDRINSLIEISKHIPPENWIFLNSEKIIENTKETLTKITKFLTLKEPLSETYQLFSGTGQPKLGDSGNNIKSGKIVQLDKKRYQDIRINRELIAQAEKVYAKACTTLSVGGNQT